MGGCSAPNCSNSTTAGKQLFRFPKDPVRMRKWVINSRRDFEPTPCSRLCEDHFEESQFEEVARSPAGRRKLKPNAVPTLFNVPNPPSPITPTSALFKCDPGVSASSRVLVPVANDAADRHRLHSSLYWSSGLTAPTAKDEQNLGDHGYARRQQPGGDGEDGDGKDESTCTLCQHYRAQLEQQQQQIARLQKEAHEMKKKLQKLNKIEKGLQVFLFEDQIRALTLAKRSRRAVWSEDTVVTARRIRGAVGVKGYEFLRQLGYPLPSYRTLCNRLGSKLVVPNTIQEELAELGLGLISTCDSPEENGGSHEGLLQVIT